MNAEWEQVERRAEAIARSLTGPTLLVRGGQSELVSEAAAQAFLVQVPGAEYVDVAEARHMVAGDRNDVFGDAILRFLHAHFGDGVAARPARRHG